MSSQLSEPIVSKVFIAKCAKCKVKDELEACKVCDEAKCKVCAAQHLIEAEERWETIEITLLEIENKRKIYINEIKNSLDSLDTCRSQLNKAYETILDTLKKAYNVNTKQINNLIKIYQQKNELLTKEWKLLEENEVYKTFIESGQPCFLTDGPTELEILIERVQYYFREEWNDDEYARKQFQFESVDQIFHVGNVIISTSDIVHYEITLRRLKFAVRRQYPDIEERIARVSDSERTNDDLLCALNGPLSTRETRMEAVAWIAVCKFNCRIFDGFVRDWIVGGYSAKPSVNMDSSTWITYTRYQDDDRKEQRAPHIDKEFVPNDIDCYLPENGFDIDQFLNCLRGYGVECGALCKIRRGYVLLLDEHRSPFTMDLIASDSALKFHKYRILDIDVNNLYVEKGYRCELGMRGGPTHNQLSELGGLETIVKHIKEKRFKVMRDYDIEDRVEKLINRGWTQLNIDIEDDDESSNDEY